MTIKPKSIAGIADPWGSYTPESVKDAGIDIYTPVSYTKTEQSVKVVSKFPATIKKTGQVTGKLYIWMEAGAIVEVAVEDVAELLTHKVGETSCCGNNSKGNILFEVV